MNSQRVSTETIIKGRVRKDAAWRIISDFGLYSTLMTNVDKVIIHDRDEREGESEWFVTIDKAPVRWLEKDHYDPMNYGIQFESIDGDFEQINGSWKVEDYNNEGIKLDYSIDYNLGIPVIEEVVGDVLKEKMKNNIDSMMQSIADELIKSMRVEERRYPRNVISKFNNISLNGKDMRPYIFNISRQGMMFASNTRFNSSEALFTIDEVQIKADLLFDTDSTNKTRAIFQREIRQDELDHILIYLLTKNIRSHMRTPIEKSAILKSAHQAHSAYIIDISPAGMYIGHLESGNISEEPFEIGSVSIVPRKRNYSPENKTVRIQYAKVLSEKDFTELLKTIKCSQVQTIEMQIA
jgi:ribosome-associated toxin RatA of RatAB toxin-antitoxin module